MTRSALPRLPVVAVHGVGYHVPLAALDDIRAAQIRHWTRSLADGLGIDPARLDLDFAYYAHFLNAGPVAQGSVDANTLGDPLAQELLTAWLKELGAPELIAMGTLTSPLRHSAAWVAKTFSLDGRLTQLFIRLFFREVATYLRTDGSPVRLAAREEVATRIAHHRPRVVIAHSLGTVVAYEALHAHPELHVELLLTLGSPLALPHAVFHRLDPRPGAPVDSSGPPCGIRPSSVTRWVNVADPGDPVAIPPCLARAFTGIALDLTGSIHATYGFHHAKNYLSCAATAATLGPYLDL